MSNSYNQFNLGEQFKDAVQDALNTGDFRKLNHLVTDTVTDAVSEAGRQVKHVVNEVQKEAYWDSLNKATQDKKNAYQEAQSQAQQDFNKYKGQRNQGTYENIRNQKDTRQTFHYQKKASVKPYNYQNKKTIVEGSFFLSAKVKNVGQVSSVLYMVFGSIGIGLVSIAFLIALIFSMIGIVWPIGIFILLFVLLAGTIFMTRKGINEKERLKRMKRYVSLCAGKMYVNIADLAKQTNKSARYILKDVKKMLDLGFFPEGHLDEKEACLMLDDATYREYLKVEKERRMLQVEEPVKNEKKDIKEEFSNHENLELQTMLKEGQEYIRKLREMNDLIEGEVISQKMYRMENLLKEIFERVEEEPSQMSQMHRLMNYYLPTTIKLLQGYEEFDGVSTPGEEIIAAKEEIEKTVDIINEAFEELLNKLFQSTVFDVTTDAQVLQTMLAKEGLTKNVFSEDKK